ncbi:MAG: DUF4421 family protein [Bacteroidetes bacterium]|nr:DUF4421 family protein [Bacteroidota bacterium]
MRQRLLPLLFLLPLGAVHAQLGDKLRDLLASDTAAPPDHDTTYIVSYRERLVVSAVTTFRSVNVDLEGTDRTLSYTTNSASQFGFGLDYKWLSVEATFQIPAWSASVPGLGSTTSRGFGLGITGRRLWGRAFWNRTQGFYLDEAARWVPDWTERTPTPVRGDLVNNTVLATANFALSTKQRFSQNAALFQMERQKKSAGTFVVGASAWLTDVRGDSALLTAAQTDTFGLAVRFSSVRRAVVGMSVGYTHTFAFWHKGFITLAVLPGLAYQYQEIRAENGATVQGGSGAGLSEFRIGAGFNGDAWYMAMVLAYYYSTGKLDERIGLGTTYGFARFALGLRFGGPRIKGLDKVGL